MTLQNRDSEDEVFYIMPGLGSDFGEFIYSYIDSKLGDKIRVSYADYLEDVKFSGEDPNYIFDGLRIFLRVDLTDLLNTTRYEKNSDEIHEMLQNLVDLGCQEYEVPTKNNECFIEIVMFDFYSTINQLYVNLIKDFIKSTNYNAKIEYESLDNDISIKLIKKEKD